MAAIPPRSPSAIPTTDIVTQISAVQAALDKVALGPLEEQARHCVTSADSDELMAAVARLMRRG